MLDETIIAKETEKNERCTRYCSKDSRVTLDPKIKETAQTLNQIKFERALVKAPVCFNSPTHRECVAGNQEVTITTPPRGAGQQGNVGGNTGHLLHAPPAKP